MENRFYKISCFLAFILYQHTILFSQENAIISEETLSLDTYSFSKANPVPILAQNPKIYPYYKFEEYEHQSTKKDWKVITLENEYIQVFVLPEIGGKVWGAIEKSTGQEFLYKNKVVKFRNIAMRGPWTSGGIEFNFGIIGHHPSTATPIDYKIQTNADGSVSCFVGSVDLPSNTQWRVEIRLEKDKAYFETKASWYNASPLSQSYYNWMTAAAVATNDLEFFIPGNAYVEHNGDAHSWPIDTENRNLSFYKNNNFGPSKSYHIVGEYNDFFGGYYHNRNFGFGQWAPYEEMPGQKLWLWDLSRAGGIWEDLLTDNDGQYIEFQAGRLFDQYFPGAINPISQVGFDPHTMDHWREIWFGYKDIGGMVDASEHGVLNVEHDGNNLFIGLNALQNIDQTLEVIVNEKIVFSKKLTLLPMQVFTTEFPVKKGATLNVSLKNTELSFSNDTTRLQLKRPFYPNKKLKVSETEQLYQEACEAIEYREYAKAYQHLITLAKKDPSHRAGLVQLAGLEYRKTNYKKALTISNEILKMDTYDSGANYIAGITYIELEDTINALESLGWAARDIKYRSVSYAHMAEQYLSNKKYKQAKTYAKKALDFNRYNLNAKIVMTMACKKLGETKAYNNHLKSILTIDPLNMFVKNEKSELNFDDIHNEFPEETLLSIALIYSKLGLRKEAIQSLKLSSATTKNTLFLAYLLRDSKQEQSNQLLNQFTFSNTNFIFPYRRQMLPALKWASKKPNSWKIDYLLAQNYIAVGLEKKGKAIMKSLKNLPDADAFYRFRAELFSSEGYEQNINDYKKALSLNPADWKIWEENILFLNEHKKYDKALILSKEAYKKFPKQFNIGMAHSKSLLNTGDYYGVINVMKQINVLPYEHASDSRKIYERAHIAAAIANIKKKKLEETYEILIKSKEWPENIGVGKPYNPDERMQDYLLALTLKKMGQSEQSNTILKHIIAVTKKQIQNNSINHLFGLLAAEKLNNSTIKDLTNQLTATTTNNKSKFALDIFENRMKNISPTINKEVQLPNDMWQLINWALKN